MDQDCLGRGIQALNTVKNCWNHAKILPQPVTVTSGPSDAVIVELKALLVEFSDSSLDVENVVDPMSQSNGLRHLSRMMRTRQLCMRLAKNPTEKMLMIASQWSR
jgi:hypothetical protein